MRRTFASLLLVIALIAIPIYMSGQTGGGSGAQPIGQPMTGSATDPQSPGSGRTYGEVNNPNAPGYQSDEARRDFDFGWLGLLGLAGLLGLRHNNRHVTTTR